MCPSEPAQSDLHWLSKLPSGAKFGLTFIWMMMIFAVMTHFLNQPTIEPSSPSPGYNYVPATNTGTNMTYSEQVARQRELGEKVNPTQAELREFIRLDARLGVQEGQMSKQDFESWTHEKY